MHTLNDIQHATSPGARSVWRQERCAYDLRDALREEFIRCARQGKIFPQTLRQMLARVEAMIASMERVRRLQTRTRSATSRPAPSQQTPRPAASRPAALEHA